MKLKIKKLDVKKDERGWLSEIIQAQDVGERFGLVLITVAKPGQTKGKHYHKRKKEWYCVIKGIGKLVVWSRDNKKYQELEIGDRNFVLVEIPQGYFHSITNIGKDDLYLLAYVNESFDPNDPDTYYE